MRLEFMASLAVLALVALGTRPASAAKAFPEAMGFGANAQGGRRGVVHEVTNLNDAGPGSLRACVEAKGARTCVFRLGGTIQLKTPIITGNPYLTIAGQTAPGGGIALRLAASPTRPGTPIVIKGGHNVIVRHLRLRPGPSSKPGVTDAFTVENSHDVIVDHVSMSWAPDENLNAHEAVYNLTVQWSVLSEALMSHSKGSLTCSNGWQCRNISLHHNLYVSNRDRNPDLNAALSGSIDVINNVFRNPKSAFVEVRASWGGTRTNVVGNTFRKGPNTISGWTHAVRYNDVSAPGATAIYVAGNTSDVPLLAPGTSAYVVPQPVAPLSMTAEPVTVAYDNVLARVGAWPRDAVDTRVVANVHNRTGALISSPSQVGGWPVLAAGSPPGDADHDGMADAWELARGLSPSNAADGNLDRNGDGYTNLEEYLNELASKLIP